MIYRLLGQEIYEADIRFKHLLDSTNALLVHGCNTEGNFLCWTQVLTKDWPVPLSAQDEQAKNQEQSVSNLRFLQKLYWHLPFYQAEEIGKSENDDTIKDRGEINDGKKRN